jgi:hypothetical protein
MGSSEKTPKLDLLRRQLSSDRNPIFRGVQGMNVIAEVLTKFFVIGTAGGGAFLATTYVLSNNWL